MLSLSCRAPIARSAEHGLHDRLLLPKGFRRDYSPGPAPFLGPWVTEGIHKYLGHAAPKGKTLVPEHLVYKLPSLPMAAHLGKIQTSPAVRGQCRNSPSSPGQQVLALPNQVAGVFLAFFSSCITTVGSPTVPINFYSFSILCFVCNWWWWAFQVNYTLLIIAVECLSWALYVSQKTA